MANWGPPLRRKVRDQYQEALRFRVRAALGFVVVLVVLAGLGAWYFKLQVIDHADYAMRSQANRIKPRPVVPARGLIYDRKGRILADNVPAYRLDVVPDSAGDIPALLSRLSRIIVLDADDVARFNAQRRVTSAYKPVTLKLGLSDDEVARFAVDQWRYPGVEVVPYLTRRYPYGDLFAHEVGYVGRVDVDDLKKLGDSGAAFTHTGKAGIERYYDAILRGKIGYEQVETNVDGRPLHTVGRVPATPGTDLRLSLDVDLQRAMIAAFGDFDGSGVATDPRTGEILAMVSLPAYDPNLFVNGISVADYKALNDNPSRPLFNRNVLGGGPPGSTVKPFLGLAGVDSGMRRITDKTLSTGEFHIPGQRRGYRDAESGGAGWVDLPMAITESVNTYFYKLAMDMGIARFDTWMSKYGFGQPTGVDLSGETSGILPSPEWKAKHSKEPWYVGETVIAGIGQGYWKATTLQLARGVAALADDGLLRRPHLAVLRRDGYTQAWRAIAQPQPVRISDNADHLDAVRRGMIGTTGPRGTARGLGRGAPYVIAGKTGTAQTISRRGNVSLNPHTLPLSLRHQAWFIGYAPADDPKIAVAVMVEHGGFGASSAAPIVRKVMDAWLLGKMPDGVEQDASNAATGAGVDSQSPMMTTTTTPTATAAPESATPVPAASQSQPQSPAVSGDTHATTPASSPEKSPSVPTR